MLRPAEAEAALVAAAAGVGIARVMSYQAEERNRAALTVASATVGGFIGRQPRLGQDMAPREAMVETFSQRAA